MPTPARPQPDTDHAHAPSARSDVDETATAPSAGASGAAPADGFGPPAADGEVGTLGPYRVVKELGRGGMGAVYAALDTRLGRKLALKVMLPEFASDANAKERFLREARAAARVKHDNVVTVYEADERAGVPYIAMEFLEGVPLDVFLKKKGTPTLSQTLRIVAEAATGLAAAHKLGLVHRDIKPANLWLEAPNGRVKVLDFGLARPVNAEVELTKSGAVVGTPAYMSPEQARGERVDHRTDLFSLGAVLYRLCAGKLPFNGPTTLAVLMALGTEEPPPVREVNPEVPESLAALIHQLLSKRADDRPPSALEVAKRLRAIAGELSAPRARPVELSTSQPQVLYVPIQVTAPAEQSPFDDLDAPSEELTSPESVAPAPKPERKKAGGRGPLLIAGGLLALAVLFAAGVIIVIKNKDGTETKIEVPDGATVTVKDKDGKTLAQVPPVKAPAVAAADPDRTAAEWVIAQGGEVRTNPGFFTRSAAGLPKEPFALVWVSLGNTPVSDVGLAQLKGIKSLQHLNLWYTKVGDAGLAQLKPLKSLTELNLNDTPVTDAGLAHLKELENLTLLILFNTKVGDAGMAHLKGLQSLTDLYLGNTKVGDAGLAHLKDIKSLKVLLIGGTVVTDAGLAHLKEMKGLTHLSLDLRPVTDAGLMYLKDLKGLRFVSLYNTPVTDAGLEHLKELRSLTELNLGGTPVTDVGLKHLAELKGLKRVIVGRTKVTAKGLEAFHAAVPGCRIEHDGGVIEAVDMDRTAAEWVLAQGGLVQLNGEKRDIKAAADLPKGGFALTAVSLNGAAKIADADLANLKGLQRLAYLDLADTRVTGTGLVHLKGCKALTSLGLQNTPLTEAGVANLKDFPGLTTLSLSCTSLSNESLAHLKGFKNLKDLVLWRTPVSDAGLEHLAALDNLTHLDLRGTQVKGPGFAHLKALKSLKTLLLLGAPVTDAGAERLADLKWLAILELNDTAVTDAGLKHLAALKDLTILALNGTAVTDAGLKHFANLNGLKQLDAQRTKVTAEGLGEFHAAVPGCRVLHDGGVIEAADVERKVAEWVIAQGGFVAVVDRQITVAADLPKDRFVLKAVSLDGAKVTDADLARLKGLAGLGSINLNSTRVSDAGLVHLGAIKSLTTLYLNGTKVTDTGLAHLKDLKGIQVLTLQGTEVTDAGLTLFGEFKTLTGLNLVGTKATAKAIAAFHESVPGCKIEHDGGIIEALDVDRKAAEWVIAQGGSVRVNGEDRERKAAADLPKDRFALTAVSLDDTAVSDTGVAQLKELKGLRFLGLSGTKISDAGPKHLKDLKGLIWLNVSRTTVSDKGLEHIKECKELTYLRLDGTQVTDTGLVQMKNLTNLTNLYLGYTKVSDAGLAHLKDLTALTHLDLRETKVTAKGLGALRAAVPGCKIEHDGGVIEPKK